MSARIYVLVSIVVPLLLSPISYAQQQLTGVYNGRIMVPASGRNPRPIMIGATLEVTSVENGKVTGKWKNISGDCRGDYEVSGSYQDNQFDLLTSAGALRGCGNAKLVLKVDGGKLVGKLNIYEVELSK